MGKIIPFPLHRVRAAEEHTVGYKNMSALIEAAAGVDEMNFFLDVLKVMEPKLYREEVVSLLELATDKLDELERKLTAPAAVAAPSKDEGTEPVYEPGVYRYTPEMGEEKPNCQIEASLSYYGKHYFVNTPLELKGRGITEVEAHWVEGCQKAIENWKCYKLTKLAFKKLTEKYPVSMECCLD